MKVTMRTTLDKDLAVRAKEIAQRLEISLSALLERALDRYLPLVEDSKGREHDEKDRRA